MGVAVVYVVVMWDAISHTHLLSWLALMLVVSVGRYLTLRKYQKASVRTAVETQAWLNVFIAGRPVTCAPKPNK